MTKTLGIVLSGGRGSRIGNADKGLQLYQGAPLVSWVIKKLKPQVDELAISINRNKNEYAKFALSTVFDKSNGDWLGPISGILAVSQEPQNQPFSHFLICPCDSPNISKNYVERLQSALLKSTKNVAVAHDGKRVQNLHCLISNKAINALQKYYDDGGRSMYGWLKEIKALEVDFSDQTKHFININTFNELDT